MPYPSTHICCEAHALGPDLTVSRQTFQISLITKKSDLEHNLNNVLVCLAWSRPLHAVPHVGRQSFADTFVAF